MKWLIAAYAVGLFLLAGCSFSCSINPSKVTDDMAKLYGDKITYFQDERTGICFAVIASRKFMSTDQTGLGITAVDCQACEHLIVGGVRPQIPRGIKIE